ncbi:hypothetical protein Q1695_011072 [Nippostrongylus brasiliensis]|nr:hypothetical protein Q1695_011072 [Nippostrongylus brasiliensis]
MSSDKVFILAGARTPIASFRGSFASVSAVELGAIAAKTAIERAGVAPEDIEESFVGSVLTANCGQNVARQVAIAVGIPKTSQAVTINKVCSSSMKALALAALSLKCGYRRKVPFYLPRGEIPYGGTNILDGVAKDGLEDAMLKSPMGLCAEKSVKDYNISRSAQDEFAVQSYKKAAAAWKADPEFGLFAEEVIPVTVKPKRGASFVVSEDEEFKKLVESKNGLFAEEVIPVTVKPKRGASFVVSEDEEFKKLVESKVPTLSAVFVKDGTGTITAANASSLNDGGVAAVVARGDEIPQGVTPLVEVVAFAEDGGEPVDFTVAPIGAARKLLEQAKLSTSDIALWEVNEAFSATVLAFIQDLKLDPAVVNVKGGAVALGHPLGMSGLRIVLSLAYSLSPGELGVAAICNGGGEAMAMLLRKPL